MLGFALSVAILVWLDLTLPLVTLSCFLAGGTLGIHRALLADQHLVGAWSHAKREGTMPVARSNRQREMYNELRLVRSAQSLSRQQLADLVEVNVQTIGALERGHYSPSLYLALLIAKALDVDVGKLFWLTDEPKGGREG